MCNKYIIDWLTLIKIATKLQYYCSLTIGGKLVKNLTGGNNFKVTEFLVPVFNV